MEQERDFKMMTTPIDEACMLALLDLLKFGAIFVLTLNVFFWLNDFRTFIRDQNQQEYLK